MTDAATDQTVVDLLARRAVDDRIGLLAGDRRWTWREVVATSAARGERLRAVPGDGPFHIGLLCENTPDYVFTLLGASLAGATLVGLNTTRRGEELARDIRHTQCRLVLHDEVNAPLLDGLDLGDIPVARVDAATWPTAPPPGPTARAAPPVGPDDLFVLLFTSGSTGAPKAVRMSHGRATRLAIGSTWLTGDDVLYSAMPLFHGNALNAIVLPALACGAAIALRSRFSASEFMPDVRRFDATFFSTVGRALSYILATPESPADRDHRVKFAVAPESSPADVRAFRHRFGITCVAGYGSSENAIIMVPVPGMAKEALGMPAEGIDAAVVDPETRLECPPARFDDHGRLLNAAEAIGEIVGRNVVDRFEGYWDNPEAEAARTRHGWYWSGDLGYRGEDGIFWFAGRTGDWLRVDGENFATAPVERILGRFAAARAVAVYAVPDERTADDQLMVAFELEDGAAFDPAGFAAFLDEQPDLGTKWAPRYVRLTTLPVGATGKVDARPLRRERWSTDDPLFWRPGRHGPYRPFTPADRDALEAAFAEHGRSLDRP